MHLLRDQLAHVPADQPLTLTFTAEDRQRLLAELAERTGPEGYLTALLRCQLAGGGGVALSTIAAENARLLDERRQRRAVGA